VSGGMGQRIMIAMVLPPSLNCSLPMSLRPRSTSPFRCRCWQSWTTS
jgi:hypothetical protein